MKKILAKIRNDRSHAGLPFWSWNDRLEEKELRRQIRNMKELGVGGFFMHARGGLETPYLSKEWFDSIRVSIDEAKKLGLEAWAYDENGWPSGFAGGALLDDPTNHAAGVMMEYVEQFPEDSDDLLGVYRQDDAGVTRLEAPNGAERYLVLRRQRDYSYVDVLNPAVTRQFLEKTHDVYRRELGEDFGGAMPGFFTDEPQYFRWGIPWSDTFRAVFAQRFGYDVRDKLPALFLDFPGAEEFRYDYHLLLHECFINNFMKPIYDWCEAHGVKLTGHGIEEWGLAGQMMCCGGVMPLYRYQHIPGIDYLGRWVKSIVGSRQLGSVCEQVGRPVRLSEMFACCGWDVSPLELKRIADVQFVGGVNLICEHLYPYSERGQRKRDYPNHYSPHNPWQGEYRDFETYYTHLGAALSEGRELASVLVIHPIHSAYLHYKHNRWDSVAELDRSFNALSERLSRDHVSFHYGDETLMRDLASVERNILRVGNRVYDTVIVPYCHTMDASTVALLKKYLSGGGKLLLWEGCPDRMDGRPADLSFLHSTVSYDEILADRCLSVEGGVGPVPLYLHARVTEGGRLFYFANPSDAVYRDVAVTVKDCPGLVLVDPMTMETSPLRGKQNGDGSVTVLLDFTDSSSCLLAEMASDLLPMTAGRDVEAITLDLVMPLVERPENSLLLDEAAMALDGGDLGDLRPIEQIRDELLQMRFSGDVTLRFPFTVETVPESLILVAEPMRYRRVAVNGHEVTLTKENGRFDPRFLGANVAPYLVSGDNEITMTFAYYQSEHVYRVLYGGGNEALRNCLTFDTEVENVYLYGDFSVKASDGFREGEKPNTYRSGGPFVIAAPVETVNMFDVVGSGYPFFAGKMTVGTTLYYRKGDPTHLVLKGRFAVCRAEINGRPVAGDLFTRDFDLTPYLEEGENDLRLTVVFSNRNLFGPHHREDPEPTGVDPRTFSFEGEWANGSCPAFVREKAFVRFGIL